MPHFAYSLHAAMMLVHGSGTKLTNGMTEDVAFC